MTYIGKCPNCGERKLELCEKENRYCKWIDGYCDICGYKFRIPDEDYDFVQPNHPAFYLIYGKDPFAERRFKKRLKKMQKEEDKARLEEKYWRMKKSGAYKARKLHDWEIDDVKKIVLNGD